MDSNTAQRVVLGMLLEIDRMITVPELQVMLTDVPRVGEAVEQLRADGLVNRVGELVGSSRAARRADELSL